MDAAAIVAAKLLVGAAVLAAGFFAVSDDDFSRVVIAQRFATHPNLDPSGTSWLPLPFWLYGSAMAVFGRTLLVARGVALALGAASAVLVHRAARWAGASRVGAVAGAFVATAIPTAARLGVSFQPEAQSAALIVLGAASLNREGAARVAGGAALALACLCRYEAWPAALVFAALCLWDSRHGLPRGPYVLASVVAVSTPLAWIAHGVVAHGDALFFVHRVAAYRRALGASESVTQSLFAYPLALIRTEPEVVGAALVTLAFIRNRGAWRRLERPLLVVSAVFVFLVVGRFLDGAPTHHEERTLLPVWTLLALIAGEGGLRATMNPSGTRRAVLVAAAWMVVALGIRAATPPPTFENREDERAIGDIARTTVPSGARLWVDTADYGYFAVIAAFGAPERALPFDDHDPRKPHPEDAFASAETLQVLLASTAGDPWFIARAAHARVANDVGVVVATVPGFALLHASEATP